MVTDEKRKRHAAKPAQPRKPKAKRKSRAKEKLPELPPPPPPPGPEAAAAIEEARKRNQARPVVPQVAVCDGEPGKLTVAPNHSDFPGWGEQMQDVFGTGSRPHAELELNRLVNAMGLQKDAPRDTSAAVVNSALAFVAAVCPRNEVDGALASQMAATHILAMDLLRRSASTTDREACEVYTNLATKLSRTYVAQCEALAKMRRDGSQKVRVEHIHIYPGAKAHVGDVTVGGGGSTPENEERAHVPMVSYAPGTPLWGANPEREPMPTAGNAQGPVPDAWRREG